MFLDVKDYRKHKPPMACKVREDWSKKHPKVEDSGVVFPFFTDTGAQVCVLEVKLIEKLGMGPDMLLKMRMNISCANKSNAGTLGMIYAHWLQNIINFRRRLWQRLWCM